MFGITHAPDLDRPGLDWFNVSAPVSLADLRGRLVILDFWTFCCVNCLHALATLRLVEDAFGDSVAVIGAHSPKFPHERDPQALAAAIQRLGIRHPVAHDPARSLSEAYCARAWPTLVFISPDGMIIGQMSGEPDPDMLLNCVGAMLEQFRLEGQLCPSPLPPFQGLAPSPLGALRFPGKIKPCRPRDGAKLWAIANSGGNDVILADDSGRVVRRWGGPEAGFRDGAEDARFRGPEGLACDDRAIYVADTGNHAIRRVDLISGRVATLLGNGRRGEALEPREAVVDAALASPWDLEVRDGSLWIANAGSHQILHYDLADELLSLAAGGGYEGLVDGAGWEAHLAQPSGLSLCPDGDWLYFADSETSAVRRLSLDGAARVETLVGAGLFEHGALDGAFSGARLQHPLGLSALDGRILVADSFNSSLRLLNTATGLASTLAPACADSACRAFAEPAGIAWDGPHRALMSDSGNHRIVEIRLDLGQAKTWLI